MEYEAKAASCHYFFQAGFFICQDYPHFGASQIWRSFVEKEYVKLSNNNAYKILVLLSSANSRTNAKLCLQKSSDCLTKN